MSVDKEDIAISYYVEEIEKQEENNFNIEELIDEIENVVEIENIVEIGNTEILDYDLMIPQMINYNENFTVKDLLMICDYYGFAKDVKANKFNKEQIIDFLVSFETDTNNSDIVFKRQNMWFYMNELKNDKFMKKFVLW
jgi:hypothetical protein